MISTEKRKAIDDTLRRICAHELFARSSTYTRLLKYLVEKALAGEDLKEFTIGTDLFKENYTSNNNDGTVRSKMYKLRIKLAKYYEEAGRDESLKFNIRKGQYNLSFDDNIAEPLKADLYPIKLSWKDLRIGALVISLLVIALLIFNIQKNAVPNIWKSFLSKKAQNIVVVSDHYIVNEMLSDSTLHAVLYEEIMNDKSLYAYKQKNPSHILLPTDYTLMSKMSPYGIKTISQWLLTHGSNFEISLESRLDLEDISNNNLIFIGQSKMMNLSKSLFLKDSKVFTTYKDGFKHSENGTNRIYNTEYKPKEKTEYAMVSYTSFIEGKKALYFVSNNDIGVLATLKKFTNKQWVEEFEKKMPKATTSFNALFEVSGLQRTDVSCKLVELELIEN